MLRFGTDGVRGLANEELTPELVTAFGRAAAVVFGGGTFVVGRDTRRSGPLLEAALVAGLAAEGAEVHRLGVAPTPAVAWLAAADGAVGAMVSASHNSFEDNGVKLFTTEGGKLTDEVEARLEAELGAILAGGGQRTPLVGVQVGTVRDTTADIDRWAGSVVSSLGGRRLDGLQVVVDCANGAASGIAPQVLVALGATIEVLHDEPDGVNINAGCGSTSPADLQRVVERLGADVGLAFDGDADRVLAVDGNGRLIDGDQMIAVLAVDRRDRGLLANDTVVVTVMTNLGFRLGMADHGIAVVEVPVGDRHVLTALAEGALTLGGEQSGHVIFADLATTGDGLLTAVQLLDVVHRTGRPLAALADSAMTRLPQVLRNVPVADKHSDIGERLVADITAVEAELGDRGRVLIRGSGTEPLVRVMVEAPTLAAAQSAADRLVRAVEDLGAG